MIMLTYQINFNQDKIQKDKTIHSKNHETKLIRKNTNQKGKRAAIKGDRSCFE